MPGIILIDDNFTGLALDATIAGRIPPVNNGSSYLVDPNSSAAVGGGNGDVKFTTSGTAVKINGSFANNAIQIVMNDNGGNESFAIYTRDTANTPFPRYGYSVSFDTRYLGGTNGVYSVWLISNYNVTAIGAVNRPFTFASSGINTVALESIGSTHRIIINNTLVDTFTDTTHSAGSRYSVVFGSTGPSIMRMDRFTIMDSIVITASAAYPIVTVA